MDILQLLTESLEAFKPQILKNNQMLLTSCRLISRSPVMYSGTDFHTVLITETEEDALALTGEVSNCVFAIGAESSARFAGCTSSVVLFAKDTDSKALYAATVSALSGVERFISARHTLLELFLNQASLEKMVSATEEILDSPIAVFDIAATPVALGARFKALGNDAALREYRENGYISFRFSEQNMFREFLVALESATRPFTFQYSSEIPLLPRRVHKIYIRNTFVAHCSMLLVRDLSPVDDAILAFFCRIACRSFEQTSFTPYRNNPDSVVLSELLSNVHKTEQAFYSRAELLRWAPCKNFYVLNFPRRKNTSTPIGGARSIPAILLQELLSHLPPQTVSARYLVEADRILMLIDMKTPQVMAQTADDLNKFLQEGKHLCALSRRFGNILEFREHVEQTEMLVHAGIKAGLHGGLLTGNNLFFQRISLALQGRNPEYLCLPELLELRALEPRWEELSRTVYIYLKTGHSVQNAASQLFIHRNTLLRRLERFQELTGLNLNSGEDSHKLYLSFKLLGLCQ